MTKITSWTDCEQTHHTPDSETFSWSTLVGSRRSTISWLASVSSLTGARYTDREWLLSSLVASRMSWGTAAATCADDVDVCGGSVGRKLKDTSLTVSTTNSMKESRSWNVTVATAASVSTNQHQQQTSHSKKPVAMVRKSRSYGDV